MELVNKDYSVKVINMPVLTSVRKQELIDTFAQACAECCIEMMQENPNMDVETAEMLTTWTAIVTDRAMDTLFTKTTKE